MNVFDKLRLYIDSMEQKDFYKYFVVSIILIFILLGLIIFYYHGRMATLAQEVEAVNEKRMDVRQILTTARRVAKQRAEVKAILAKDEDFRLGGYYEKLLNDLHLTNNGTNYEIANVDQEDNYRETILKATLINLNMQMLCELLLELKKSPRVYTKELEITKSKTPHAIDINLTIATLEPKTAPTE